MSVMSKFEDRMDKKFARIEDKIEDIRRHNAEKDTENAVSHSKLNAKMIGIALLGGSGGGFTLSAIAKLFNIGV